MSDKENKKMNKLNALYSLILNAFLLFTSIGGRYINDKYRPLISVALSILVIYYGIKCLYDKSYSKVSKVLVVGLIFIGLWINLTSIISFINQR